MNEGIDLLKYRTCPPITRGKRGTCKKYLQHVHEHPCSVCGNPVVEAHHSIYKSAGNFASDVFCVPLCQQHHQELHKLTTDKFEQKYGIDLSLIVAELIVQYICK